MSLIQSLTCKRIVSLIPNKQQTLYESKSHQHRMSSGKRFGKRRGVRRRQMTAKIMRAALADEQITKGFPVFQALKDTRYKLDIQSF